MTGCRLEVGTARGIFRKEGRGRDEWFINVCCIKNVLVRIVQNRESFVSRKIHCYGNELVYIEYVMVQRKGY
jgi:hypothetical protein